MSYFRDFPSPNQDGRYPGNIDDFRFAAPVENTFRTYIARGDYRLNGSHNFFGRFNKQDDAIDSTPQYPGAAPDTLTRRQELGRGDRVGLDASAATWSTRSATATRASTSTRSGCATGTSTRFRFIDDLAFDEATAITNGRDIKTHNFVNDLSMVKGRHTFKFGGNMRFIRNDSYTFANSYTTGTANGSWVSGVGQRYRPGGPCPAPADCSGLPAVASGGPLGLRRFVDPAARRSSARRTSSTTTRSTAQILPHGDPVGRVYGANEFELYAQDSWHVSDNLTVSAGLRYGLYSPPWEVNGQQVAPNVNLGEWFDQRVANMRAGIPSSASEHDHVRAGRPGQRRPGLLRVGQEQLRAARLGGVDADPVVGGARRLRHRLRPHRRRPRLDVRQRRIVRPVERPRLAVRRASARRRPRSASPASTTIPATYPDAPPAGFPATPETGAGAITSSIDQSIRTPYSHVFNVIVGKDLGSSYGIEVGYVGRRGRNLLVRRDIAMPLNLTDPASGVDYFTAARQLIDAYNAAGGDVGQMAPDPVLGEHVPRRGVRRLHGDAEHGGGVRRRQRPTTSPRSTTPTRSASRPAAASVRSPSSPSSTTRWRRRARSARSEYDAMQLTLRRRFSRRLSVRPELHAGPRQGPRLAGRARAAPSATSDRAATPGSS